MSTDVLLVFPGLFFEVGYPLGLAYLAASLKEAGLAVSGHDVQLQSLDELARKIDQERPKVIGLAVWAANLERARDAAALIRERTSALLVVGGPQATIDPRSTLAHTRADLAVVGEGERTMVEIAQACIQGRDPRGVLGTAWLKGASIRTTPPRPPTAKPSELPWADREVFPLLAYGKPWAHRGKQRAPVVTSRGCPCRCRHCSAPALHDGHWRGRDPQDVVDEMRWLQTEHGVQHVMIEDEHPFVDRPRFREICERLEALADGPTWGLPNGVRPEVLDEAMVKAMAKAGCRQMSLGLESADPHILARLRRHADLTPAYEVARWARAVGIDLTAYFMLGVPGERARNGRSALRAAIDMGATSAHFSLFLPVHGSDLDQCLPVRGTAWRLRRAALYMAFYAHPERAWQVLRHAEATPADLPSAVRQLARWLDYGGKGAH